MNLSKAALFELIAAPNNRHSCPNLQLENQLQDPRKNSESCRRVKCALRNLRPAHFQKTGVGGLLQCTQNHLRYRRLKKRKPRGVFRIAESSPQPKVRTAGEWASGNNQLNMKHTSIVCSRLGAHPGKTRGTWRKRGCETLRVAPLALAAHQAINGRYRSAAAENERGTLGRA